MGFHLEKPVRGAMRLAARTRTPTVCSVILTPGCRAWRRINSPAATSSPPIQLVSTGLPVLVFRAFNLSAVWVGSVIAWGASTPGPRSSSTPSMASGRTVLTETESKRLLELYRIPVVPTRVAATEEQAVALAAELACPAVLKLYSQTITHKSDVGGVQLNLLDAEAVRRAYRAIEQSVRERVGAEHFLGVTVQPMVEHNGYELIFGCSPDPQFGPVLLFGAGGQQVELIRDRTLGLPPLNTTLARRMMEHTRIFQFLQGIRGGHPPIDLGELERLLVRFSELVVEQPRIREIDINPLLATPGQLIALDARVILHGAEIDADRLPRPAIRPYPTEYVVPWTAPNGLPVTIRPIRPEDEPLVVRFHEKLSEDSVYLRFFQSLKLSRRVAHERLTRVCFVDFNREMALVADAKNPETGENEIIAMGRLSRVYNKDEVEFSLEVRDAFQRRGLGTELLSRLVAIGRDEQIGCVSAVVLPYNHGMLRICEKLGFHTVFDEDDRLIYAGWNSSTRGSRRTGCGPPGDRSLGLPQIWAFKLRSFLWQPNVQPVAYAVAAIFCLFSKRSDCRRSPHATRNQCIVPTAWHRRAASAARSSSLVRPSSARNAQVLCTESCRPKWRIALGIVTG